MSITLRNIPPHCQEEELRRALFQYGTLVSVSINPHLRQATVTMRTPQETRALLNQRCINLFGQSVTVEHSSYGQNNAGGGGGSMMPMAPPSAPTRINVVVDQCAYTVTKDVLSRVFGMVSPPLNVFCGPPGMTTTGWVEYMDPAVAQQVVQTLNNNPIYPDCCYMSLSVDHTGGSHTSGPYTSPMPSTGYGHHSHHHQPHHHHNSHHHSSPSHPSMPFGHTNYGAMPGSMPPSRGGMARGRGRGGRGGQMGNYSAGPMPHHHHYAESSFNGQPQSAPVVIVSNVTETVPLRDLWTLLEVYGNVNYLKRQFSSKTTVVAHFQNVHDARLAVQHLQSCQFHGSVLLLKHFAGYEDRGGRTEWNSGPATDPATLAVDFTIGYHHRTKPSAAFNPTGRVRPSKNLFISNLTATITDDDIKSIFVKEGFDLEGYFRKTPSVAIVALAEVETAVRALIAVHSVQLKERFLRVTFSHFPPGPRGNGGADGEGEGDGEKDAAEENEQNDGNKENEGKGEHQQIEGNGETVENGAE